MSFIVYNGKRVVSANGTFISRRSSIPRNGLVGEWLFSGNANDTSGYGNDGIINGATLVTDRYNRINSAYSINGALQNITIENAPLTNFQSSFSLSVWINSSLGNSNSQIIGNNFNSGWMLDEYKDSNIGLFINGNGFPEFVVSPAGSLIKNKWVHILAIYNDLNREVEIYIDNEEVIKGTVINNIGDGGNTLRIGIDGRDGVGLDWKGYIDDIRLYNRILSQYEINLLYNE